MLAVGAAISAHVNKATGTAWPSRAAIAEMAGTNEREVTKAISRLRKLGLIDVEVGGGRRKGADRKGNSSTYRLRDPSNLVDENLGSNQPGLSLAPKLVAEPSGNLVSQHPPERTRELYQKTSTRSREREKDTTTGHEGGSESLVALLSKSGFDENREREAAWIVTQCRNVTNGIRVVAQWAALALEAEESEPFKWAIRQTTRGEHFAEGQRAKADALIGAAKAEYGLARTLHEIQESAQADRFALASAAGGAA